MPRIPKSPWLVLVLALGVIGGPVVATDDAASDSAEETKSVVSDVLRMLGGGVSSRAIVEWLQRQPTPIPPLTPDEMIGLSRAGASDDVIETLNRMSDASATPPPPPPLPVPAPAELAEPAAVAATTAAGEETAGVLFSLKYKYPPDTGDEFDKRWTLWVYVDGTPTTYSRSQSSFVDQTIETFVRLEPGRHVVRLLRESHAKKGKKGYRHESYVNPDPIFIEVEPGDGWRMEITYVEKTFNKGGPITWALKNGSIPVDGRQNSGQKIHDWHPLCDDMESNVPEGKKTPNWVKQQLEGCVNWASLSDGVDPWPERGEIIAWMQEYDYKPPRDQQ